MRQRKSSIFNGGYPSCFEHASTFPASRLVVLVLVEHATDQHHFNLLAIEKSVKVKATSPPIMIYQAGVSLAYRGIFALTFVLKSAQMIFIRVSIIEMTAMMFMRPITRWRPCMLSMDSPAK